MENTDKGAEVQATTKPYVRPLWVRLIHYSIRQARKRKADKQPEEPTDKAARRTAIATIWIAFFTLVLAIANIFELIEIKNGGVDTHNLALAAGTQATATQNLVSAFWLQGSELL